MIEEIYSAKFRGDAIFFGGQTEKDDNISEFPLESPSFPIFTYEFLKGKYKNQKQINQVINYLFNLLKISVDLIATIEYYQNLCHDVETFGEFLNETYNTKDLIFFLYIRSALERAFKFKFTQLNDKTKKSN